MYCKSYFVILINCKKTINKIDCDGRIHEKSILKIENSIIKIKKALLTGAQIH